MNNVISWVFFVAFFVAINLMSYKSASADYINGCELTTYNHLTKYNKIASGRYMVKTIDNKIIIRKSNRGRKLIFVDGEYHNNVKTLYLIITEEDDVYKVFVRLFGKMASKPTATYDCR